VKIIKSSAQNDDNNIYQDIENHLICIYLITTIINETNAKTKKNLKQEVSGKRVI